MPSIFEAYDRALHQTPAQSVQMAQSLLACVKNDLASGKVSREEIRALLDKLYDQYAEKGCIDEREAIADVLDAFDGWSPLRAAV